MMDSKQFIERFASQFEDAETVKIELDTKFRELPTWDSMTAMCVQTMVLDDYNVNLPDDKFKSLVTVADVFTFVNTSAE